MKITLITLLALCGMAAAGDITFYNGDELKFATTLTVGDAYFTTGGFRFTLESTSNRYQVTTGGEVLTDEVLMPSMLSLESFSFISAAPRTLKAYIVDTSTGKVVGLHDSSITTTNSKTTPVTLNFSVSNVILASGVTYDLVFVNSDTNFATAGIVVGQSALVKDETTGDVTGYLGSLTNAPQVWTTAKDKVTSLNPSHLTLLSKDNNTTAIQAANVYSPSVTIVTKVVPEPTTATLSLLALAGLAARRRRK